MHDEDRWTAARRPSGATMTGLMQVECSGPAHVSLTKEFDSHCLGGLRMCSSAWALDQRKCEGPNGCVALENHSSSGWELLGLLP